MKIGKLLRGLMWLFLVLTLGLSPYWAAGAGIVFMAAAIFQITLFGLSAETTQLCLYLVFYLIFCIALLAYRGHRQN